VNGVSSHPCSCEQAHHEYGAARWALLSEADREYCLGQPWAAVEAL